MRFSVVRRLEFALTTSGSSARGFLGWVTFGFTAVCAVGGTVIALTVSAPVGLALLAVAAPAITIQIRR